MKVRVAAGGTFGHINPAKVIADEIKDVLTEGIDENLIFEYRKN